MRNGIELAAVDLGSNSFRLEIAEVERGQLKRRAYLRETVRQGKDLDENGKLTQDAMQRGWDCLARFARRLTGFHPEQVRAVATQTLREARNGDAFLEQAQALLGFPIEVISGQEEARLIYQGVTYLLPPSNERRLVVDIGGRSTELIAGVGRRAQRMDSYPVGSVSWSQRYFATGQFNMQAFEAAEGAAQALLARALEPGQPAGPDLGGWDQVYGASGTVGAVSQLLDTKLHARSRQRTRRITRAGLDWLRDQLLAAGDVTGLRLAGVQPDHHAVIGGGLSVLRAMFSLLDLDTLRVAQGGLRHGALVDLLHGAPAPA
jgi:exopolyphosphatase/guanosine-5'-triphosphate,3'-diphosphate pyrophosphatase